MAFKTISNTEAFREDGITFHKREKVHAISSALKKRQQVLGALSEEEPAAFSKDLKPTNCPQLHPVERFIVCLKQAVYAGSWKASSIDQQKKRVHLEVKDIDVGLLRNAFRGLVTEARHAANNGL